MYILIAYQRNKKGLKGQKVFQTSYPSQEAVEKARDAIISLRTVKNINRAKNVFTIDVPCDVKTGKTEKSVKFENYIIECNA